MRDEDAALHKLYLIEGTTKEQERMEEEDIDEKYDEIVEEFKAKDLQALDGKFNLIEMLEDAAKSRGNKKKGRRGKKGGGKGKGKKGM